MKTATLLRFVHWALPRLAHVEIRGREHAPRQGSAIFVFNHLGLLDIALAFMAIDREDASGWVADKHKRNPLYAYLVNVVGGVWLDRQKPDMSSFKQGLAWLREGKAFGVAPEGTRSPTQALLPGKEGVAFLAAVSGALVVPAGHTGTERVWQAWLRLRKPRFVLRFGEPFALPPLERGQRDAQLKQGIDEVMCRIAALLPEDYRGAYAEHPRLKQLMLEEVGTLSEPAALDIPA